MPPTESRLADAIEALAAPRAPLPHSVLYRARSAGQGVDGRVTLRLLDRDGLLPDSKPVSVWCGVPGVSAKIPDGSELALGFFRGDPAQPFAMMATPLGLPTHVPNEVAHDARDAIKMLCAVESVNSDLRMVEAVGSKAYAGLAPTFAVALAPQTISAISALQAGIAALGAYGGAVSVYADAAIADPVSAAAALTTAAGTLATAMTALGSALAPLLGSAPAGLSATKLESA